MQSRGPLLATADIHSPRYLSLLSKALARVNTDPCAVLLAGDIVDRGNVAAAAHVFSLIRQRLPGKPIIAVFGNEEYHDLEDEFRKRYPYVTWLDDEYTTIECREGGQIAIVGTRGALDRPTPWQRRNMPWLERVYRERPTKIARLIDEARREAGRVVLLSHYALSRATIRGENPRIYPYLYSRAMERVIAEKRPDAAVHGHAHRGTPRGSVAGVPVYNVALPLVSVPVIIRLARRGLDEFLR